MTSQNPRTYMYDLKTLPVMDRAFVVIWNTLRAERINRSKPMVRLIAVAVALIISASAQAAPLAPLHQPENMVTQVREACGAGMHMVNGQCIRTSARRNAARCAVGMRSVGGRCVK